jgi:hypothetical protein
VISGGIGAVLPHTVGQDYMIAEPSRQCCPFLGDSFELMATKKFFGGTRRAAMARTPDGEADSISFAILATVVFVVGLWLREHWLELDQRGIINQAGLNSEKRASSRGVREPAR